MLPHLASRTGLLELGGQRLTQFPTNPIGFNDNTHDARDEVVPSRRYPAVLAKHSAGVGGDVGKVSIALGHIKSIANNEGWWNLETDIVNVVVRGLLAFSHQKRTGFE